MNSKAFTLIELLVVISILGILASVVLISMEGAADQAERKKAMEFSHAVRVSLGADLVGEWRFNETAGTEAKDSSGYDNHGTLVNFSDPPDWTDQGVFNNALIFDGINDYVNCGTDPSLTLLDAITMEAWVFPTSHLNYPRIVKFGVSESNNQGIHLQLTTSDVFRFYIGDGAVRRYASKQGNLNEWTHLVGTFDGQNVILYMNGVFVDASAFSNVTTISYNNSSRYIGTFSSGSSPFIGTIDEVCVYNRALSSAEIQQLYVQGAVDHGLVLNHE